MDPQDFLRVGLCGVLGQAAAQQWLACDSWVVTAWTSLVLSQMLACQFTQLAITQRLLNTGLKDPCLVASSWLLVVLGVLGWSGARAPLPRLCTLAGHLAQRSPPGGHVSCYTSCPASPVPTEAYLGDELTCKWLCL